MLQDSAKAEVGSAAGAGATAGAGDLAILGAIEIVGPGAGAGVCLRVS